MPFDSNGNYTLPTSYFVENGDTVLPIQHNPPFEDVAQALSATLVRDGRSPMSGDLKMGTHKITFLAEGTSNTDAVNKAQMDTALGSYLPLTGGTLTDTLTLQKLVNAFWAGLKVRNTGTGDAAIQAAAANRDFSSSVHVEFGQRANGSGYLWVVGKQWVMNSSGDMSLPNNGILYGTGDMFCAYGGLNTLLSTVLGRMRQTRLGPPGAQNVNRSGWNYAPSGAAVTGVYKDGAGEILNFEYRYVQTTDLFGNWANIGVA
ncbi:hypothetical protein FY134_18230 [Agrobacterium fabrum]|jgi:hypothetical protein|uniref:hypothetical protein n=1 Tax=Agrobacterium fabrum TaxID=1176649 RepID=UPI0021D1BC71|nr:hypothetical protein [Agrobacterium fabrum]UXT59636.1 hypothetical protein FY134_18230 [Agrobacterium fabrum]